VGGYFMISDDHEELLAREGMRADAV